MGNDSPMSQRRIDGLINYRGWNANLKRALDKRGLLRSEDVAMKFVVPCYSARQAADLVPQEDAGVRYTTET